MQIHLIFLNQNKIKHFFTLITINSLYKNNNTPIKIKLSAMLNAGQ